MDLELGKHVKAVYQEKENNIVRQAQKAMMMRHFEKSVAGAWLVCSVLANRTLATIKNTPPTEIQARRCHVRFF